MSTAEDAFIEVAETIQGPMDGWLRSIVNVLMDEELGPAAAAQELARWLADLKFLKRCLGAMEATVTKALVDRVHQARAFRGLDVPGVGALVYHTGDSVVAIDTPRLNAVMMQLMIADLPDMLVDVDTGERVAVDKLLIDFMAEWERLHRADGGWRAKELKQMGVKVKDFGTTEPGPPTIQIPAVQQLVHRSPTILGDPTSEGASS